APWSARAGTARSRSSRPRWRRPCRPRRLPMGRRAERTLVIVVLDPEGQQSAIALSARRHGHRVVTATGMETALLVLGSLVPDVVIVRSSAAEREAVARLSAAAPRVAIRVVDAEASLASALDQAPDLLN